MERYILTCPGRKAIKHDGFELFVNDGKPYVHNWMKCAKGHAVLLGCGEGPVLILEDDVMLSPDFESRLKKVQAILPDPGVGMLYVGVDIGLPVDKAPCMYPPEVHGWGTQATLYSPTARKVALNVIQAFLNLSVATVHDDNSIPQSERRHLTTDGVQYGFDITMYKALYQMVIPVFQFPCVQHMCLPSKCHSNVHTSPFFPPPPLISRKDGWW